MKSFKETKIIGIDHGYGNMKTANHCFKTGIFAYNSEPLFTADMLTFNGKYYLIGEGHKEFAPDKVKDEDYYVLTLAAIAKELRVENLTEAHVVIAAGLPLTWTSGQTASLSRTQCPPRNSELTSVRSVFGKPLCRKRSEKSTTPL